MNTQLSKHLEKVQYFQVVAEVGSIQEASKIIGIAQPALSKSLKILEDAVGCLLLERTRRGTSLTNDGQALLKFSYKICDLIESFEDEITDSDGVISGSLRIGMHELYVPFLWPQIINEFAHSAPGLKLELYTDVSSSSLLALLEKRQLDVVIAVDSSVSNSVQKAIFYQDRYCFYHSTSTTPAWENIFYLPGSVVDENTKLQALLDNNKFDIKPSYQVNSYASILSLTLSGVGVGILPEKPANFYVKRKLLKKVEKKKIEQKAHDIFIYSRSASAKNRKINFLISNLSTLSLKGLNVLSEQVRKSLNQ